MLEERKNPEGNSLEECFKLLEEGANKIGYGLFLETEGQAHLIPITRTGYPTGNHIPEPNCICEPRLIRTTPVKVFEHKREI